MKNEWRSEGEKLRERKQIKEEIIIIEGVNYNKERESEPIGVTWGKMQLD